MDRAADLEDQGASRADAEAAAVVAFGAPHLVASSFGTDLVAVVDGRLSDLAGALDVWLARHPWAGAAVSVSPLAILTIVVGGGGALSGLPALEGTLWLLAFLAGPLLWRGLRARAVRARPEPGLRARLAASRGWLRWRSSAEAPTIWVGVTASSYAGVAWMACIFYVLLTRREAFEPTETVGLYLRAYAGFFTGVLLVFALQRAAARWRRGPSWRQRLDGETRLTRLNDPGVPFVLAIAGAAGLDSVAPLAFRVFLIVVASLLASIYALVVGPSILREGRRAIQRDLFRQP